MQGNLVNLRAPRQEDSNSYFRWINDRELVLQNSTYRPISEVEHERWFNNLAQDKNQVLFSIVENEHGYLIGSCSLRHINWIHSNAELQIRIGEKEFHGRGYGAEAITLLLQHGFNDLHLQRIYLEVFSNNTRAISAYEKAGFITEGVKKKAAYINGVFIDILLMAIIQ